MRFLAVLLAAACTGDIVTARGAPAVPEACQPPVPRRLVRLSNRHYSHAVRDLLGLAQGPTLAAGGGVAHAFFPLDAKAVSLDVALEYHEVAAAVAAGFTPPQTSACDGLDERGCARATLAQLVPRAFRRPVSGDELDRLLAVWDVGREGGTALEGLQLAVEAVLQSPSFVYRTELGDGSGRLTSHEIATQLAFLLLDSGPDDALWAAAEAGELADEAGRAAQVQRLLAEPRVRSNVGDIFLRWFGSGRVERANHDDPAFTPELAASMRRGTELFVDDVLWQRGGSVSALLTTRELFVDAALARHLGVAEPQSGGFERVALPAIERAGLLTQPSMLARLASVSETSVVRRGLFVAAELLCVQPQPPPAGTIESAAPVLAMLKGERAKAEYRMSQRLCGGCHGQFDPFGLVLEGYDELGRYRTTLPDGARVDARWELDFSESLRGRVDGAVELSQRLASSPELKACAGLKLASYVVGEPVDSQLRCLVDVPASAGDVSLVELLERVARSPHLVLRSEPP